MSCRNREYEMSLSLDGRLPSGQRAGLLRHITSCRACGTAWRDMLAAREMARELPTHDVSADLSDPAIGNSF